MTTVVCSKTQMACDSIAVGGQTVTVQKVWRIGDALVGISGTYADCRTFIRYLEKGIETGEFPEHKPDMEDVMAIMLSTDGIRVFDHSPFPYKIEDKLSGVGSGAAYALGAVAQGADLRAAIKIAARFDASTGGRIKVYDL